MSTENDLIKLYDETHAACVEARLKLAEYVAKYPRATHEGRTSPEFEAAREAGNRYVELHNRLRNWHAPKRIQIKVDFGAIESPWWKQARRTHYCPDPCSGLVYDYETSAVVVGEQTAAAFRAWAEKIPGWEHNPFIFTEEPSAPTMG